MSENAITAKITYGARIAALVEKRARRLRKMVVIMPTNFISNTGNIATILSEKPMI